ncbi:hypothetical protein Kisp01_69570 [Kineosporia sp. NBRC 101677]|uniref:hypothetical protein n=1 Tax=Kineosporia sp. NBRC 101677 TaxID=3032197 RepID=UPI0024A41227|nr:hypothetical protein [Kineosporia sp. NBRC 101677]GLY19943.1 hypothetical protein Kisp01_69570 [Kineosporia sp. NBRC 101677]
MNRVALYVRALLAAAALAGMLFGLPVLMAWIFGNPLPDMDALRVGDFSDDVIIHIGASVAWVGWAYFVLLVLLESRAQIIDQAPPPLPGLSGERNVFQPLIAALLLSAPVTLTAGGPALASSQPPPANGATTSDTATTTSHRATPTRSTDEQLRAQPVAYTQHPAAQNRPADDAESGQTFLQGMGSGVGLSLTAAGVFAAIRRRRQHHNASRRPGCLPATIPPDAANTERLVSNGARTGEAVRARLQQALDHLDAQAATANRPHPPVLAAHIDEQRIDLILTETAPDALPAPWRQEQADPDARWWTLAVTDQMSLQQMPADAPAEEAARASRAWVWIGSSSRFGGRPATARRQDDVWLLNLRQAPVLRVIGPEHTGTDLVRAMALSAFPSSNQASLRLSIDSTADELIDLAQQIHTNPHTSGPTETGAAPADSAANASAGATTAGVPCQQATSTSLDGRPPSATSRFATDQPEPHYDLLIIDTIRPSRSSTPQSIEAATVLTLTNDLASVRPDEVRLVVDATGQLHTSFAAPRITAAGLSADQFAHLRPALQASSAPATRQPPLAQQPAASEHDQPRPPITVLGAPAPATTTTAAQNPAHTHRRRPEGTRAGRSRRPERPLHNQQPATHETGERQDPTDENTHSISPRTPPGASLLDEHEPATLITRTGIDPEDLLALAPILTPDNQATYRNDPTLDADLAQWHNDQCPRPKLRLLGPIHVTATGTPPSGGRRIPWLTEVVTLLSAHPEGLTYDQLAENLWPDDAATKAASAMPRQTISAVRRWLGTDPHTSQPYLPEARKGGDTRGIYRINHLLTDADLARRLRARGAAKGPDGLHDLQTALDLVTGTILEGRRRNGYAWLTTTPLLTDLNAMISEIAHTLAVHWLTAGHPARAEQTARTAVLAGSVEDAIHLDLIAALESLGRTSETDWWIQRLIAVHDGEVEEDLPPRTLARLDQVRQKIRFRA